MLSTELAFLNIGTSEMMLIVVVALLLFGGKKLPELARGLGRGIREFKDASENIKRDISDQINNFEKDLDVKDALNVDNPIVENKEPKKLNQSNNDSNAPAGTYQHNPNPSDYYGSDSYADDYGANDATASTPSQPATTDASSGETPEASATDGSASARVSTNETKDA